MSLWYEKYRPKVLDDIIMSKSKKDAIIEWFEKFRRGETKECSMFFIGPPGLGKTSTALVLLNHYGYKVKEFNASDIRNKSLVKENLDGLINHVSVFSHGKVNAIIMDEVDGMFKGDKGGIDTLLSYISIPSSRKKAKVVNYNRHIPIICICNDGSVKKDTINNIKKNSFTVTFTKPSNENMLRIIDKICKSEDIELDTSSKEELIHHSQGDMRRLICILEHIHNSSGGKITKDCVTSVLKNITMKSQDLYVTNAVSKIINGKISSQEIFSIYRNDKSKVPMVINENYPQCISSQKCTGKTKLKSMLAISDAQACADEIEKIMYNSQNWGLQKIQAIGCAHIPYYYINMYPRKSKVEPRWTKILSTNSQTQNLKISTHGVLNKMSTKKTYMPSDLTCIIELIFIAIIKGKTDKAIDLIKKYRLIQDIDKCKNIMTEIDKLSKFIKISKWYKEWKDYKVTAK